MTWTYAQIQTADRALIPPIDDLTAAAAALNAQTVTTTADIATSDARSVILLTGEWVKIKMLSKMPLSGASPPSPQDQAITAADLLIDTFTLTATLHFADEATWQAVQPLIGGLRAAGVLSQASIDAWTRMRAPTVPAWQPSITPGDIQTARSQP